MRQRAGILSQFQLIFPVAPPKSFSPEKVEQRWETTAASAAA